MLNILLIENQAVISAGIEHLLMREFPRLKMNVVGTTAELLSNKIDKPCKPGIVLLGSDYQDNSDERCMNIDEIHRKLPGVPLILYNYALDYMVAVKYFRFGICGYVLINSEADLLAECIRTVLSGRKFISIEGLVSILRFKKKPGRPNRANELRCQEPNQPQCRTCRANHRNLFGNTVWS